MPSELALTIEGDETLLQALRRLDESQRDLAALWPKLANTFYDIERRQFQSEGGRAKSWSALSPEYAAAKAVTYPGQPILQASGALMRSLTSQTDEHAIYDARPDGVTLGTSDPKAVYHQEGTRRMPARPPIDLIAADYEEMGGVVRDYFREAAQALGFEVYLNGV